MSDSIRDLTERIRAFADARDWEKYHTPKSLAMALIVEAAELVEQFQWHTADEAMQRLDDPDGRAAVENEIADVLIYLLRLADVAAINVGAVVTAKLAKNEERFPANESGT